MTMESARWMWRRLCSSLDEDVPPWRFGYTEKELPAAGSESFCPTRAD
jgi:hypothetical protein